MRQWSAVGIAEYSADRVVSVLIAVLLQLLQLSVGVSLPVLLPVTVCLQAHCIDVIAAIRLSPPSRRISRPRSVGYSRPSTQPASASSVLDNVQTDVSTSARSAQYVEILRHGRKETSRNHGCTSSF